MAVIAALLTFGKTGHARASAVAALITLVAFPALTAAVGPILRKRLRPAASSANDPAGPSLSGQSTRMHERPLLRFYLPVAILVFAGVSNLFQAFDPEPRRIVGGLTGFCLCLFSALVLVKVWSHPAP